MRYNTLASFNMTAQYMSWGERFNEADGLTYREYDKPASIRCHMSLNAGGSMVLNTKGQLQPFGIIHTIKDPSGVDVMNEVWYQIQTVQPVFDAWGNVSSYRHRLSTLDAATMMEPINPRVDYPDLDQSQ